MLFVGIDPGLHGAVALIDGQRTRVEMHDCPLTTDGKYDKLAMAAMIRRALDIAGGKPELLHVTLEGNHAAPQAGRCKHRPGVKVFERGSVASFALGRGGALWEGILAALGIEPAMPSPEAWKPKMLAGLPKGKASSVQQVIRLFPSAEVRMQLYGPNGGIRDGKAEAVLLAELGRREWKLGGMRNA